MVCGVDDLLCHVVTWVSENGSTLKDGFKPFIALWDQLTNPAGQGSLFLKAHGEKILAAATFSFAVWRWWLYREAILHKRLEEYSPNATVGSAQRLRRRWSRFFDLNRERWLRLGRVCENFGGY